MLRALLCTCALGLPLTAAAFTGTDLVQAVQPDRRALEERMSGLHRGRSGRRVQHDRGDRRHDRASRGPVLLPAGRHDARRNGQCRAPLGQRQWRQARIQREHGPSRSALAQAMRARAAISSDLTGTAPGCAEPAGTFFAREVGCAARGRTSGMHMTAASPLRPRAPKDGHVGSSSRSARGLETGGASGRERVRNVVESSRAEPAVRSHASAHQRYESTACRKGGRIATAGAPAATIHPRGVLLGRQGRTLVQSICAMPLVRRRGPISSSASPSERRPVWEDMQ